MPHDLLSSKMVRVKKLIKRSKMENSYEEPSLVVSNPSPHTVRLEDGRVWNSNKLLPVSDPITEQTKTMEADRMQDQDDPTDNVDDNNDNNEEVDELQLQIQKRVETRFQRNRRPPTWLKDYVVKN